jgi:hypothetical protein
MGKTVMDETFATAYNACIDSWSWSWQNDFGGKNSTMCKPPVGDAVVVSKRLIAKYKDVLI